MPDSVDEGDEELVDVVVGGIDEVDNVVDVDDVDVVDDVDEVVVAGVDEVDDVDEVDEVAGTGITVCSNVGSADVVESEVDVVDVDVLVDADVVRFDRGGGNEDCGE